MTWMLGYPNRCGSSASATAQGSWETAAPAANVLTRNYAQVARSTNADAANTVLGLDLGAAATFRVLALPGHNLSAAAQIALDAGTTSGGTDVVVGSLADVWSIDDGDGSSRAAVVVLPAEVSARYVTIRISDEANADGYVQLARAWLGPVITPTYDPAYGLQHGLLDMSSTDRSDAGALWVTARRRLRTASFALEGLSLAEADALHELQRAAGTTEEVLYLPHADHAARRQRYGFVGTLQELSAIEYPWPRHRRLPMRLTETA